MIISAFIIYGAALLRGVKQKAESFSGSAAKAGPCAARIVSGALSTVENQLSFIPDHLYLPAFVMSVRHMDFLHRPPFVTPDHWGVSKGYYESF